MINIITLIISIILISVIKLYNGVDISSIYKNSNKYIKAIILSIIAILSIAFTYVALGDSFNIIISGIMGLLSTIYNHNVLLDKIKIKHLLGLLIVFLVFELSPGILVIPQKLFNIDVRNAVGNTATLLSIFQYIWITIVFIIFYYKDLKKDLKNYKENRKKYFSISMKYWLIGLGIMYVSNIAIAIFFRNATANNEVAVQERIAASPYLNLIAMGILAPFVEEIVFRKSYYDAFKNNKWIFVITSGLVFGALHVVTLINNISDYLYLIPYTALGIAFGLTYYDTKNMYSTIIIHMMHNSILILLSILVNGL